MVGVGVLTILFNPLWDRGVVVYEAALLLLESILVVYETASVVDKAESVEF